MADEHASIAASTLVARSQRSHGVSAALAARQRTSNMPPGGIQASRRELSVTYDFDISLPSLESPGRIVLSATEPLLNLHRTMLQAYFRPARSSWPRPLVALATCPPFRPIASFWPGLGINNCPFDLYGDWPPGASQIPPPNLPEGNRTPVDNLVSPW